LYLSRYGTLRLDEIFKGPGYYEPAAFSSSFSSEAADSLFPLLKDNVLCDLSKFDVARIVMETEKRNALMKNPDGLFIICDLENGKIISTTLTAGMILGRCEGRKSIADIATELSAYFNIPYEIILQDCRKIISTVVEADMCVIRKGEK
jgi:hypothetical protein